jgi:hypothetical protein
VTGGGYSVYATLLFNITYTATYFGRTTYVLADWGSIPGMARYSSSLECSDELWSPRRDILGGKLAKA